MKSLLTMEIMKFRRTLGPVMIVAPAILVAILFVYPVYNTSRTLDWSIMTSGAASFWAVFILPLLAAGVCITTASVEEESDGWTIIKSASRDIKAVYFSKFIIAWAATSFATALFIVLSLVAMYITSLTREFSVFVGTPDWVSIVPRTLSMSAASVGLLALCFLAAHWFRGAVVPMILGVISVIAAVLVRDFGWAYLVPTLSAYRAQRLGPDWLASLTWGGVGGLVLVIAVIVALKRRQQRR